MTKSSNGLLPCPCCGSVDLHVLRDGRHLVEIKCQCGVSVSHLDRWSKHITAWNTRVVDGHKVTFHYEQPGVISETEAWVVVDGCYMYCAETWQEVEHMIRNEWQHDRHLVG